jgi:hypothetical protein
MKIYKTIVLCTLFCFNFNYTKPATTRCITKLAITSPLVIGLFWGIHKLRDMWHTNTLHSCSCINADMRNKFTDALISKTMQQFPDKNQRLTVVSYCSGQLGHEAQICKILWELGYSIELNCIDLCYKKNNISSFLSLIIWRQKLRNYITSQATKADKNLTIQLVSSMNNFLEQVKNKKNTSIDILLLIDPDGNKATTYDALRKAQSFCHDKSITGILDKEEMFKPKYNFYSGPYAQKQFISDYEAEISYHRENFPNQD